MQGGALYYGDNLPILAQYVPDESADLVYLDPPFNSNRSYSAIFADESGRKSDAQLAAFGDSWHWGPTAEGHYTYLTNSALHQGKVPPAASAVMGALRLGIRETPLLAYLVEMTVRLVELHRVLKPTGSLYLHCDPTASHYLKVVLDAIFGAEQFRNEVIWKRTSAHSDAKRFGRVHDSILFYSKTNSYTWNQAYQPLPQKTVDDWYNNVEPGTGRRFNRDNLTASGLRNGASGKPWRGVDPSSKGNHWRVPRFLPELTAGKTTQEALDALDAAGRIFWPKAPGGVPLLKRYLNEARGIPLLDVMTDIAPLQNMTKERLGYPTQKPLALLERIISASTNPGDLVLDPFCGCGTALVAAQKLGRRWVGIDITYLAIGVMKARLLDATGLAEIPVIGKPTEVEGARMMATSSPEGRYQFQWWALDEIGALPAGDHQKKGSDLGVDGRITFTNASGGLEQAIISVKSGKPRVDDVRVLKSVVAREKAAMGILVSLDEPTKPMRLEATIAGSYHSDTSDRDYPRIQLLSVADLLERGKRPLLPPLVAAPYQRAARVRRPVEQRELFGKAAEEPGEYAAD